MLEWAAGHAGWQKGPGHCGNAILSDGASFQPGASCREAAGVVRAAYASAPGRSLPPLKGALTGPLITAREFGRPGRGLLTPEQNVLGVSSVSAPHPSPPGAETALGPGGHVAPSTVSELRPQSPFTFPKQMWHVMGRVRDNVTFCTV